MACVVIGDLSNLSLRLNKENFFGVKDAVESLLALYIVCNIYKKKRKKDNNFYVI